MRNERRARLHTFIQTLDTRRRSAHPGADAELSSHGRTRHLSPGASGNLRLRKAVNKWGRCSFTYPSEDDLAELLPYSGSNMARRRPAQYRANGYTLAELEALTADPYSTRARQVAYRYQLAEAVAGQPGQVEVALIGPDAPTADGASLVAPTILNPFAPVIPDAPKSKEQLDAEDVANGVDRAYWDGLASELPDSVWDWTEEIYRRSSELARITPPRPSLIEHIEPEYAWSVMRLAYWLYYRYAKVCACCEASPSGRAIVIGRGQRVLVLPVCFGCYEDEITALYGDPHSPPITGWIMDGFHVQHGWPEDWWF